MTKWGPQDNTQHGTKLGGAGSPCTDLPSEAGPYPQASGKSGVEQNPVWEQAGLRCVSEPVLEGCWGLRLWGRTTAALGQPEQGEGLGGQASWRRTRGRGRRSGSSPPAPSEPAHAAQLACSQGQLGGEAGLLLSGSPSPPGRPEASCRLGVGPAG